MSLFSVLSKFRFVSHQLVQHSRLIAGQVQAPKNFVSQLRQPRVFSGQTILEKFYKRVHECSDEQSQQLCTNTAANVESVCPQPILPIEPIGGFGDILEVWCASKCKPKCPKKKKKSNKCKKKKKSKCKKKKKCKPKKKKKECKPKKKKCKKKKKKKKKKCPKKPKCKKKKPDCKPKEDKCKKPKCKKKNDPCKQKKCDPKTGKMV